MSGPNDISTPLAEIRSKKRKFDAAMYSIDQVVNSFDSLPSTSKGSPSKKSFTPKSLFSTLTKYGISSKPSPDADNEQLSKTAPHLARILSRKASRSRLANPFKRPTPPPPLPSSSSTPHITVSEESTSEYRPSSTPAFLARLSTFKLSTYANKPTSIDAVAASRCGWMNNGRDRLVCGMCSASWVVAPREGMKSKEAAGKLLEQQTKGLVEMHKEVCPWRIKQCEPSVYRIPLRAPGTMAKEIRDTAKELDGVMSGVEIKHPLTTAQLNALRSGIASVQDVDDDGVAQPTEEVPTDTAIVTALFGWSLAPPAPPRPVTPSFSRRTSLNLSRASSVAPPSLSRAQSVVSDRGGDDHLSRPSVGPLHSSSQAILLCQLCQRRIGLWAFAPPTPLPSMSSIASGTDLAVPPLKTQRLLDPLREHRSHCPYIVRSSVVSSAPGGAPEVEGWRAVLAILVRRASLDSTGSAEADGVKEMMVDVKSRGGKDLLKYVKGLLA